MMSYIQQDIKSCLDYLKLRLYWQILLNKHWSINCPKSKHCLKLWIRELDSLEMEVIVTFSKGMYKIRAESQGCIKLGIESKVQ